MLLLLASVAITPACSMFNNDESPSKVTATTDTFNGPLAQNGSVVFTFTVAAAGDVNVTLTSVSPSTSGALGLGIGTLNGTSCSLTNSTSAAVAGSTPQLTTTASPGTYCVKVYDVGNLTAASTVSVKVAHS
jgi:hypothetical protein